MQLKAGETGGRAPSLGTSAAREQDRNPRFGTCSRRFLCGSQNTAALLPLVRPPPWPRCRAQNNPPSEYPGLTTLNSGEQFMWYCACYYLTRLCLPSVAFWQSCKKGVRILVIDTYNPSTQAGKGTGNASNRRLSTTPQCHSKPIFSSFILR